ncbi:MAG: hypothetical protein CMJ54_09675, partial [Planctomycetaceae bacterium]|nr:hypothetical protein [Planctomycetaceae bacterium]
MFLFDRIPGRRASEPFRERPAGEGDQGDSNSPPVAARARLGAFSCILDLIRTEPPGPTVRSELAAEESVRGFPVPIHRAFDDVRGKL